MDMYRRIDSNPNGWKRPLVEALILTYLIASAFGCILTGSVCVYADMNPNSLDPKSVCITGNISDGIWLIMFGLIFSTLVFLMVSVRLRLTQSDRHREPD